MEMKGDSERPEGGEVFLPSSDVVHRKIAEETILVPVRRRIDDREDSIFQLKGVGPRVWELMDSKKSVGEITGIILDEYEVDPEILTHDLERFLAQLLSLGLIRKAGGEEPG